MTAKRSRSKFTVYRPVLLTPVANERLEATLDAETAKGRQGLTFADLLREGVDLVIDRYNPDGSNPQPTHKPPKRRPQTAHRQRNKQARGSPRSPESSQKPSDRQGADIGVDYDIAKETPPVVEKTGDIKCDGNYIAKVGDRMKAKQCLFVMDEYCAKAKGTIPINCPKLTKETVKARLKRKLG